MPDRVQITPVTLNTGYITTPDEIAFTAMDVSGKNYIVHTGREIVIFYNSGAVDAHAVIVSSVASPKTGRTGNLTKSITAGKYYVTQMFPTDGWQQTNGQLYFEGDHAELKVAVLRLP